MTKMSASLNSLNYLEKKVRTSNSMLMLGNKLTTKHLLVVRLFKKPLTSHSQKLLSLVPTLSILSNKKSCQMLRLSPEYSLARHI